MRAVIAALGLGLLTVGCIPSQPSAPASTPTPVAAVSLLASPVPSPQLEAAWSLHLDASEGYGIAFPDTWNFVFGDSPTYEADLKAVNNADLIKFFSDGYRTGRGSGLKLIAAEPRSAQSGFVTNLSLFRTDLGTASTAPNLDTIATSKFNLYSKQQDLTGEVRRQQVRAPAGTFEQLLYATKPNDKTVNVSSYFGTSETGGHRYLFEVVIGTNVVDPTALFDRIIKTFRLLPGGPASPAPSPTVQPQGGRASPTPRR